MIEINPSFGTGFARRGESASPNLWTGLIGAYHAPLGPTGEKWLDQSGFRNDGTLMNMDPGTDWVMTEKGWALDFDGGNDYVNCGDINQIDGSVQFTVAGWFYVRSDARDHWLVGRGTAAETIILWADDVCGDGVQGSGNANTFVFDIGETSVGGGANRVNGTTGLRALNTWHYVVGVMNGSSRGLYHNGKLNASHNQGEQTTVAACSDDFRVGDWGQTGASCDGMIGQVAIWNRALTSAEIMQLYLDPAALFRYLPPTYPDGLPAVSDRVGRGVLTGGRM